MKNKIYNSLSLVLLLAILAGCNKKLDLVPTNDITADAVYSTPLGYKQSLAKVYGAFALTGNTSSMMKATPIFFGYSGTYRS